MLRTGSRQIQVTTNVWSDEARKAAADARKGKSGAKDKQKPMSARFAAAHSQWQKGKENYDALSSEDKEQFHKDWANAHQKSGAAFKSNEPKDHAAAADAHRQAAGTAPTSAMEQHHRKMAALHESMNGDKHAKGDSSNMEKTAADLKSRIRKANATTRAADRQTSRNLGVEYHTPKGKTSSFAQKHRLR